MNFPAGVGMIVVLLVIIIALIIAKGSKFDPKKIDPETPKPEPTPAKPKTQSIADKNWS